MLNDFAEDLKKLLNEPLFAEGDEIIFAEHNLPGVVDEVVVVADEPEEFQMVAMLVIGGPPPKFLYKCTVEHPSRGPVEGLFTNHDISNVPDDSGFIKPGDKVVFNHPQRPQDSLNGKEATVLEVLPPSAIVGQILGPVKVHFHETNQDGRCFFDEISPLAAIPDSL